MVVWEQGYVMHLQSLGPILQLQEKMYEIMWTDDEAMGVIWYGISQNVVHVLSFG